MVGCMNRMHTAALDMVDVQRRSRRLMVKRTAALLLAGLVTAGASYAGTPAQSPAHAEETPRASKQDSRKSKTAEDFITLNFTNIDINALIKVMSELTRKNFILDEKVAGKITLMTPTRISPEEAYQVFLTALEVKGFTAVEDGKIIRIIPTSSARQSGLKVFQDDDFQGEGFVTKLIRLSYVNPQEIVRTLSTLVTKDGAMLAYPATNSVILTDSVHNIRKMESLILALDVPAPEGKGKINVYSLKHGSAEEFAKVLTAIVSRIPTPPAGGAATSGGPVSILEGTVTVTADKVTNSLIIVCSPADYETIKDVIQKLDTRRKQVYVEAAIIEMGLSKQRELGFEFMTIPQQIQSGSGAPVTAFGGTNFGNIGGAVANGPAGLVSMNGLAVGAIKGTFSYKGVDYLNIGALLRAVQTDGDVNVLSTPNILTTDNQKAKIMVGENIPFITGQIQTAATGGNPMSSIDRRDVGMTLDLLPQITSDDSVRLELNLEISSVIATAGLNPNIVGPSTSKRSASTAVVVRDRETMVIGGLIRDNLTSTTSKVPLLGDIPILGWFFKYKSSKLEKTNLMIFITPYIIKNELDSAELTRRKENVLDEYRKEYRIDKKGAEPVAPPLKPAEKTGTVDKNSPEAALFPMKPAAGTAVTERKDAELSTASTITTLPGGNVPASSLPTQLPSSPEQKAGSSSISPAAQKAPVEGGR